MELRGGVDKWQCQHRPPRAGVCIRASVQSTASPRCCLGELVTIGRRGAAQERRRSIFWRVGEYDNTRPFSSTRRGGCGTAAGEEAAMERAAAAGGSAGAWMQSTMTGDQREDGGCRGPLVLARGPFSATAGVVLVATAHPPVRLLIGIVLPREHHPSFRPYARLPRGRGMGAGRRRW